MAETRSSTAEKGDAGIVALTIILITIFVVLVSCGCFFGPRAALSRSCGYNAGGATEYRDAWRQMAGSMADHELAGVADHSPQMHPIAAVYAQSHNARNGEEYSTLRHPVGALQPSTVAVSSARPKQTAGFGN